LISGGGTAGHVSPALAVVEALRQRTTADSGQATPPPELLYVGSVGGIEEPLVRRAGLPYAGLSVAGGLRGVPTGRFLLNLIGVTRGWGEALAIIRRFRPQAVFATGGYVTAPVIVAAWLQRIPRLIYLPDLTPGWTTGFLAPFASRIAVSFDTVTPFFKGRPVIVTGYPVRPAFHTATRAAGRSRLGLSADRPVILVIGGSRGAQKLNRTVVAALPELLTQADLLHISGERDHLMVQAAVNDLKLPPATLAHYHLFAYMHEEIPLAMAAADLVVSRAGASTLGEFPAVGLPAILVPYHPAAGGHSDQEANADFLVSRGAAVRLADTDLTKDTLMSTVRGLLADPSRLATMTQAMRRLAQPDAADRLAEAILSLI